MQLLPHADHIIILGEEGRIVKQGKFRDLGEHLDRYGLKELSQNEVQAALADEIDDKTKKEDMIAKVASLKAQKPKGDTEDPGTQSRGKRNADALVSYMKSMGHFKLSLFLILTIFNCGFRTAGREFFFKPFTRPAWATN